mmetsp:Transcript_85547/g.198845  ORF Transcript_85547/g.198845 Transcript_85547/m.198845 type:complete len:266 (-) Transcript_85547:306-1103(-)
MFVCEGEPVLCSLPHLCSRFLLVSLCAVTRLDRVLTTRAEAFQDDAGLVPSIREHKDVVGSDPQDNEDQESMQLAVVCDPEEKGVDSIAQDNGDDNLHDGHCADEKAPGVEGQVAPNKEYGGNRKQQVRIDCAQDLDFVSRLGVCPNPDVAILPWLPVGRPEKCTFQAKQIQERLLQVLVKDFAVQATDYRVIQVAGFVVPSMQRVAQAQHRSRATCLSTLVGRALHHIIAHEEAGRCECGLVFQPCVQVAADVLHRRSRNQLAG